MKPLLRMASEPASVRTSERQSAGAPEPLTGRTLHALRSTLQRSAFVLLSAFCFSGSAQTLPLSQDQNAFLYKTYSVYNSNTPPLINWQSLRGVPISTNFNPAAGSDGRAPTVAQQIANGLTNTTGSPTPSQFRTWVGFGALPVQGSTNLNTNLSFAQNVETLNWPRIKNSSGNIVAILRAAQVGAPYLIKQSSYAFGSIIRVPTTDENGVTNASYWFAAPFSAGLTNPPYYYSPYANAVFATQPGQVTIIWEKAVPSFTQPTNLAPFGYVFTNNNYYLLYTNTYLVSGEAAKTPQKMYWTEGAHAVLGYRVPVPSGVTVNIVYNNGFPQSFGPGDPAPLVDPSNATSTLWVDTSSHVIKADNATGRAFVELLGARNADGSVPFIGFEIVDVYSDPVPTDINVELGTRIPAYADGSGDSALTVVPPQNQSQFYYLQTRPNTANVNLWAVRETLNLNDFEAHWLITGVAGVQWPYLFDRYHEYWPSDPAEYVNYVRPLVPTPAQAAQTAVQLPSSEAPSIAYQDDPNNQRASISANGLFYTFLTADFPAHRTLLQFLSGNNVAYERVFSWLDVAIKTNSLLANSVATNLSAWDASNQVLTGSAPVSQGPVSLTIVRDGTNAIISWSAAGYALQTTTNLMPPVNWTSASPDPVIVSGRYTVTNSAAVGIRFYRLAASTASLQNALVTPYVVNQTVNVGDRITAPVGELGFTGNYLAGYIIQTNGNSYDPTAYFDPFVVGFDQANQGAIIPVNVIPGRNVLEVLWFRNDHPNGAQGFQPSYWPAVIGHYTLSWPTDGPEIILASNQGSGPLDSLQAKGSIYRQPDPTLPGYNPNEEQAIMNAGMAFALRDDLNKTNAGPDFTSAPYVLIRYTGSDGRPAIALFHVRREAPERGILFDYVVDAGTLPLQAPAPLPFLEPPVDGPGANAINFNKESPPVDYPAGYDQSSPFAYYAGFTFQDRKREFWVYRGQHQGLPPLQVGAYDTNSKTFGPLPPAIAVVGQPFTNYIHVSRRIGSLTTATIRAPAWIQFVSPSANLNDLALGGTPALSDVGSNFCSFTVADGDGSIVSNSLSINVVSGGSIVALSPLAITSTNQYSAQTVTYTGRPPFLAQPPVPTNSFTMQFYYKNLASFDWPGYSNPAVGAIVPYLLPVGSKDSPTNKYSQSLRIVYRPVWPSLVNGQPVPTLSSGQTLTAAANGFAAVRGQSSAQVLYQQSLATNDITGTNVSVTLFDPTVNKTSPLAALPAGVNATLYQGRYYFPNLPPNLVNRLYYDPASSNLVFQGQFVADTVGDSYLLLNVLSGADLAAVEALCPASPADVYNAWVGVVTSLSTPLYTFYEAPGIPGSYMLNTNQNVTQIKQAGDLVNITSSEQQVDSYAMSATGPGQGYISYIVGNSINPAHAGEPVTVYVARVATPLATGQLKVILDPNPLSEVISFQHTEDLAGKTYNYAYDWRIAPPVDGQPPTSDPGTWTPLTPITADQAHFTLSAATGIQSLGDNYVRLRYREVDGLANPANTNWSAWTDPVLAEGYIKRVLAGINPFNQRTTDLFNNPVNTIAGIISQAGHRWEGDVALNSTTITNAGLIEIYETLLHRGEALSINAGYNYGPANDSLMLAAGYLSDLYSLVANDALADAANPTIGIGTADKTYGSIATALFAFQGQEPSLLEEELALLRGRNDVLSPGVQLKPVYNRLYWNYTRGIAAGEVIYSLNYNILDQNGDGVVNAADAAILFPMGHGDAYGHYLTALANYYSLLMNPNFDWVPQIETVSVLGAAVSVGYEHERKFAATSSALARTGLQVFDLTWRENYRPGTSSGWTYFDTAQTNSQRPYLKAGVTNYVTGYWGMDPWASRTAQGAYLNWIVGNAILPPVDPDPSHQGIQKVDRTTVPELNDLPKLANQLQTDMLNAEAGFTPFDLSQNAIPFDINPLQVTGANPQTHFEQIYSRAVVALNNAVTAFDDAQNVTQLMRSEEDSLANFQAGVVAQELAYNNQLIELYGSPYPDDMGPGKTYPQDYNGPDLLHYTYVETPDSNDWGGILGDPHTSQTYYIDIQQLPTNWSTTMYTDFEFIMQSTAPGYTTNTSKEIPLVIGPDGFFSKPAIWTGQRGSPGQIQQAISTLVAATHALRQAAVNMTYDKFVLDKNISAFRSQVTAGQSRVSSGNDSLTKQNQIDDIQLGYDITDKWVQFAAGIVGDLVTVFDSTVPDSVFDIPKPVKGPLLLGLNVGKWAALGVDASLFTADQTQISDIVKKINQNSQDIANSQLDTDTKNAVLSLGAQLGDLQGDLVTINQNLRAVSDAQAAYQAMIAKGNRVQSDRLTYRQHAAALVQGFRTRDAAFRLFQNEKLQRYLTLYNLAAKYAFLAAQAYDYETGLLGTSQGQAFLNQIIGAQAIGVVANGLPQYSSSTSGDPGLAGALAQMKGDWDVLKGRLGFNNPDGYGTTVSMRTENYRILASTNNDGVWQQVLQRGRVSDLRADSDVKRNCLQIDDGSGLPVAGIILTFSTTVANGQNLFGNLLAPGDHNYSPSSFATKIFATGVCFDGYIGMDNPNSSGGITPPDPTLDPNALAATPYVYLIPVGQDSMRSPPLGDANTIRSWNVDDVAVPLPFNVSAADFSSTPFYTSANSLSEPLFAVREHQAFRPVSTTSVFNTSIYGAGGSLQPSQYTNKRLIGRSIWNSKWKLVIPGRALLADPNQGLDRFIQSVKDVHLYFITYSYAGN